MEVPFVFFGVNQPGHEADHSSPATSEVKGDWSINTTTLIFLHGVYGDKRTACK